VATWLRLPSPQSAGFMPEQQLPPYTQGFRSPQPKAPSGPPADAGTVDGKDVQQHKGPPVVFKGPCKYSTETGLVVLITGNVFKDAYGEYDRDPGNEACPIPMIIVDKMAKKLTDPDPPHVVRAHKYLKLKPVKVRLTYIDPLKVDDEMTLDKWVEAAYCAPLEYGFKQLWAQYTVGREADDEVRAALALGLKALRERAYPDMSEADLFRKLCPPDEKPPEVFGIWQKVDPQTNQEIPTPPEFLGQ